MIDVQMQLGPITFGLRRAAYQELTRATEYRWATVDPVGIAPAYQFIGVGEDTITLNGVVYTHIPTSWNAIGDMRDLAAAGLPQILVSAFGTVLGTWIITSVQERQPSHFILGIPRKQEFTITLKKFNPVAASL
jgi:phage protein U